MCMFVPNLALPRLQRTRPRLASGGGTDDTAARPKMAQVIISITWFRPEVENNCFS
jgi:hypothetical protein